MNSLPYDPDLLELLEPLVIMKRIKGIKKIKFMQGFTTNWHQPRLLPRQ